MAVDSVKKVENAAGRKVAPSYEGNLRSYVATTPAAYAAQAVNEIWSTGIVLKDGSRLKGMRISFGTGAASSTLDVGLRDARTLVAVDSTALAALHAITTAAVNDVVSGTKITLGSDYILPQDCEVYATFKGATNTANQRITIYVDVIEP
jgi:hypothetical protein